MKYSFLPVLLVLAFLAKAQDDSYEQEPAYDLSQEAASPAETGIADAGDAAVIQSILNINGITGVAIEQIAEFRNGRVVTLNLNNPEPGKPGFHDLPPDIGNLDLLTVLTLNDNDLVSLPDEIGRLVSLVKLEVRNNNLVSLPSVIGNLDMLEELDLRNNELTSLPIEIGLMRKLWKLQLWGNSLRSLPETIGSLSSLREFYLRNNRLSTFPKGIMKLKLNYIDMQENNLCSLDPQTDLWLKKFDKKYRSWQKCW